MRTPFNIIQPRDGDILNRHDGEEGPEGLRVSVFGTAPPGVTVTVEGVTAEVEEGYFTCDVILRRRRNRIVARAGNLQTEVVVFWDKGSRKRYRVSIDDNILFLKDLASSPGRYASLFDHWYLGFWREIHENYGTKVHLNLFYQTDGFDLTEMPDKWREEWQANADWLNLSFHSLQEKPDRPYRNANYAQIAHDYDLVCSQIRRFAGNQVISSSTTTHWAECPKHAITALRDRGIEELIGLFEVRHGACSTGYYLNPEQCATCDSRGAWHDRGTRLTFIRCCAVLNLLEVEQIEPYLDARTATPQSAEMVELLIHEQYFRQDHPLYQPTIADKVHTALTWAQERGYAPVFWSEGFLGTPGATFDMPVPADSPPDAAGHGAGPR